MENRFSWLVSGRSPHKALLCGDPRILTPPGQSEFVRGQGFACGKTLGRAKRRGPLCGLFGDLPG